MIPNNLLRCITQSRSFSLISSFLFSQIQSQPRPQSTSAFDRPFCSNPYTRSYLFLSSARLAIYFSHSIRSFSPVQLVLSALVTKSPVFTFSSIFQFPYLPIAISFVLLDFDLTSLLGEYILIIHFIVRSMLCFIFSCSSSYIIAIYLRSTPFKTCSSGSKLAFQMFEVKTTLGFPVTFVPGFSTLNYRPRQHL